MVFSNYQNSQLKNKLKPKESAIAENQTDFTPEGHQAELAEMKKNLQNTENKLVFSNYQNSQLKLKLVPKEKTEVECQTENKGDNYLTKFEKN